MLQANQMIILFDGVCNLCNGFVDFIIRKDTNAVFRFASLQSAFGLKFQEENKALLFGKDTVILVSEDGVFTESVAAIKILSSIKGFGFVRFFKFLPISFNNLIYRFIARNRYLFFGKRNTCRVADSHMKGRFIES